MSFRTRMQCDYPGCGRDGPAVTHGLTVRGVRRDLETTARRRNWSVSAKGHYCDEHRPRKLK